MIKIETYAQALFEVVADPKMIYQDLLVFETLLSDSEIKQVFTRNYAEPKVLDPLWESLSMQEETIRCLKLMQSDHRILDYERFMESYKALLVKYNYIALAKVTSAIKLDDKKIIALKDMLSKKYAGEIEMEISEDPSLIKGMVVKINHDVIDTSLKHKLEQIKYQGGR